MFCDTIWWNWCFFFSFDAITMEKSRYAEHKRKTHPIKVLFYSYFSLHFHAYFTHKHTHTYAHSEISIKIMQISHFWAFNNVCFLCINIHFFVLDDSFEMEKEFRIPKRKKKIIISIITNVLIEFEICSIIIMLSTALWSV